MKRISLQITLPSVGLKRFVERILSDEDFFALALESPVRAFAEAGLNLAEKDFIPADFAAFYGVLARLRTIAAREGIKAVKFEELFGQPADFDGATVCAQFRRGFYQDWGGRQAAMDKHRAFGASTHFVQDAVGPRGVGLDESVRVGTTAKIERDWLSETQDHHYQNYSSDRKWDNTHGQETHKEVGMTTGTTEDFGGRSIRQQFLHGPLIHPVDLARVTAKLGAFADLNEPPKAALDD